MRRIPQYPEFYYSKQVSDILNEKPVLPTPPTKPVEPKKPVFPGDFDNGKHVFKIIFLVSEILLLLWSFSADIEGKGGIILMIVAMIVITAFGLKIDNVEKEGHEGKKNQYQNDLKEYPSKLSHYQEELDHYQQKKQEYDKIVAGLQSPQAVKDFRVRLIGQWEREREIPSLEYCLESEVAKKGVSEDFFFNILTQKGLVVLKDRKIPVGNTFYYPDLIVKVGRHFIDIEIDEPYVGNDGTPIHYIKDYGYSIDDERNAFFIKNGFEIIRFAEEQVFLHPNECVAFISQFIDSLHTADSIHIPEEICVNKWTKDAAASMAYQHYRNRYVPIEYQRNISNERNIH